MIDSAFWQERKDEFHQHDIEENRSLAAEWDSIYDAWRFRSGSGPNQEPEPDSEKAFKSLAREAAGGLKCPPGTEPWKVWLDALRSEERNFKKISVHSQQIAGYVLDEMKKQGETLPAVEGVVVSTEEVDQNSELLEQFKQRGIPVEPGTVHTQVLFEGSCGRIDRLFKTSANYCLDLRGRAREAEQAAKQAAKQAEPQAPVASKRKRGPEPRWEEYRKVEEIVNAAAPDGDWATYTKLYEVAGAIEGHNNTADESGENKIPPPRGWHCNWTYAEETLLRKAIAYRLRQAKRAPPILKSAP